MKKTEYDTSDSALLIYCFKYLQLSVGILRWSLFWYALPGSVVVVVDLLFIVTPIVGVCNCSMFCCTLL